MENKTIEFLKKYHMASCDISITKALESFKEEMNKGLEKVGPVSECSIPMIPTYLNPNIKVRVKENVIVIDAGGTNLRVGLASFDGRKWNIFDVKEDKMPGIDREYSKEEFFDYIAKRTIPYLDKAKNIGFCFSYRVAMNKDLDGTLIAWAKEIKAKEVVGELIGKSLLKAIKKYSVLDREIVVLNDTTAVLLGGMTLDSHKKYCKYIGAIYGTGFNCCYMEEVKNIKKIKDLNDGLMIINTETGNFNGFNRGVFDEELTLSSLYKDEALTEKMSSGRYLATLIYKALVKAKEDGLVSKDTIIPNESEFDLPLVSMYLAGLKDDLSKNFVSIDDIKAFKEISFELINRASKIVATTISAFVLKSEVKEIGIILEGSTFYKLPSFKESFENYLKEILDSYNVKYQLFDGRNRILIGAAMAAMSK